MKAKIVAVTRVLNEADIIEAFIRHTAVYADHLVIMDNGSTDGTIEILAALRAEGFAMTVFQSTAVTYNESDSVTYMYRYAVENFSPEWLIFLDSDEFIDDRRTGAGLRQHLDRLRETPDHPRLLNIPMINYDATSVDNESINNPAERICYRYPFSPSFGHKIILAGDFNYLETTILHGSHFIDARGGDDFTHIVDDSVWLSHFSVRSPYQYMVKFVRGWSKVLATGVHELQKGTAVHYHDAYHRMRTDPAILFRDKNFMEPKGIDGLVYDPIHYRGGQLSYTKAHDEAMRAIRSIMGYYHDVVTRHGKLMDEFESVRTYVNRAESEITHLF